MKRIFIFIFLGTFIFSVFALESILNNMVEQEGIYYKERTRDGNAFTAPASGRLHKGETIKNNISDAPWLIFDKTGKLKRDP